MGNIYVGSYKDILKWYYKKQKELNAKVVENNTRFSSEYAEKENIAVKEQQEKVYSEARESIYEEFSTVRGLLANANFLNVESLTADRIFFESNSGFDLTVDEVKSYIERYANNYTMLRLIKDWVARNNKPTKENPMGKYADIRIVMPVDMVNTYKTFAEGALSICDKIHSNSIMQDPNYSNNSTFDADGQAKKEKKAFPLEIECYGDEQFASELFTIVGNGMGLSDYKNKRVPVNAQHAFDNITLGEADTTIYAQQ